MDSQCKFGVVARGQASLYLRLSDREQKIWDIAPGTLVVEEAGGQVLAGGWRYEMAIGAFPEHLWTVLATVNVYYISITICYITMILLIFYIMYISMI